MPVVSGSCSQPLVATTNISRCCVSGGAKLPPAENSPVPERETWVRDELLAFEKFKHAWNLINKTRRRDEYREVQGEGELEPSPSPFRRRSVFRSTPKCRTQLLAWQTLPSKVKIPTPPAPDLPWRPQKSCQPQSGGDT